MVVSYRSAHTELKALRRGMLTTEVGVIVNAVPVIIAGTVAVGTAVSLGARAALKAARRHRKENKQK